MIIVKRYTATWCGPCKMLSPIMDELKNEMSNVSFVTIDVDSYKDEAIKNNIASVPTVVISKNEKEMHRFSGVKPKSVIKSIIEQFI